METQANTQTKNLTAAQRLEGLEQAAIALDNAVRQVVLTQENIAQALKLLANKVDAIVKASNADQPLNDEVLSQIMVQNNVEELRRRVEDMKTLGLLKQVESLPKNGFVVGREVDPESKEVQNPRVQIAVSALSEESQAKIVGSKPGDLIDFGKDKLAVEIEEVYEIVEQQ